MALGKVAQALMHGAKVIAIRDNFDRALEMVHDLCISEGLYLLNSVNPYRLEGQKTIGFEVVDQLGDVPDRIVLPVGNAGNISAVHKGLGEFIELGFADRMPMMTGIQAAGSQPVVEAISGNLPEVIPFKSPETVATAIRIGAPVNAEKALRAIRQTGGTAESVTDEEILSMQRDLARKEGIGVEPASAASVAGIKKLVEEGRIDPDERIVCVVTGHLLKDPETVIRQCSPPHRDRRRYSVALICLALILCVSSVSALSANYTVAENGTAYTAEIEVLQTEKYTFTEPGGVMGEPVRITVSNITVFNETGPVNFTGEDSGTIEFPKGNYTVRYTAPQKANEFMVVLSDAANITISLPKQYQVENPLLGSVSTGGVVNTTGNGTTIFWEEERSAQVRYYDAFQEQALIIFGTFWIGLVVIFLVPYLIVRRKKE